MYDLSAEQLLIDDVHQGHDDRLYAAGLCTAAEQAEQDDLIAKQRMAAMVTLAFLGFLIIAAGVAFVLLAFYLRQQ